MTSGASEFPKPSEVRFEIQGLRAIAVALVVLFHVWPSAFPGGYVGVDVFFVISGFLITSHLLRELEQHGRVSLPKFYERRARRLLPLALFVLWVVGVLTPVLLPPSQWKSTLIEIFASAFYFENWRLAALSVDYLGAEEAPSALQHYWSLSVEEQFYIFWPLLMIGCGALASRLGLQKRRVAFLAIGLAVAASLAISIAALADDKPSSYFVTQARVWELGLGALLAAYTPALGEWPRRLCGVVGVVLICLAGALYSHTTRFPGYAALMPVLGTFLVILAGRASSRISAHGLLSLRPFQVVGDLSYSIYLWHWPILIFYRTWKEGTVGLPEGLILIAITVALSMASKRFVEDRFRQHGGLRALTRSLNLIVGMTLISVGLWGATYYKIEAQRSAVIRAPADYPGALALEPGYAAPTGVGTAPPMALVRFDKAAAYNNGCHLSASAVEPISCQYGRRDGAFKVFLVGDSHAANWIPALEAVAKHRGWNAIGFTKSSCAVNAALLENANHPYRECQEWATKLRTIIAAERPDLVIFAQMRATRVWNAPASAGAARLSEGFQDEWRFAHSQGAKVIVMADTPEWPEDPDLCLFKHSDCHFTPRHVVDPAIIAARGASFANIVDLNDKVCPAGVCPAVIGNVIVWRDRHHLTATYSRSMSTVLERRIEQLIAGTQPEQQAGVQKIENKR